MAEVSTVTVHSHYFQINTFGDSDKLANSGWLFTFHNVLLLCSLRSSHDLNDVRFLERRDIYACVLPFIGVTSRTMLTHTSVYFK